MKQELGYNINYKVCRYLTHYYVVINHFLNIEIPWVVTEVFDMGLCPSNLISCQFNMQ